MTPQPLQVARRLDYVLLLQFLSLLRALATPAAAAVVGAQGLLGGRRMHQLVQGGRQRFPRRKVLQNLTRRQGGAVQGLAVVTACAGPGQPTEIQVNLPAQVPVGRRQELFQVLEGVKPSAAAVVELAVEVVEGDILHRPGGNGPAPATMGAGVLRLELVQQLLHLVSQPLPHGCLLPRRPQ